MSNFLGLPHTVSGVLGGVGDFLGGLVTGGGGGIDPFGFIGGGGVPPSSLPTVGGGTIMPGTSNPCATKAYEIVTTVNTDGTTSTKTKCKTRKRRRRLATQSDIRDLAALKSILGGGKAFDSWIATRGR